MDEKQSRKQHLKSAHNEFMKAIHACIENADYGAIPNRQDYIDDAKSGLNKNKFLSIAYAVNYIREHHEHECHECGITRD